jgi:hypothetical protein
MNRRWERADSACLGHWLCRRQQLVACARLPVAQNISSTWSSCVTIQCPPTVLPNLSRSLIITAGGGYSGGGRATVQYRSRGYETAHADCLLLNRSVATLRTRGEKRKRGGGLFYVTYSAPHGYLACGPPATTHTTFTVCNLGTRVRAIRPVAGGTIAHKSERVTNAVPEPR